MKAAGITDANSSQRPGPGREVRFKLGDLICPDYRRVLAELGPEVDINGRIEYLSDRGQDQGYFAVVAVDGVSSPVVVPLDRVQTADSTVKVAKTAM